MPDQSTSSGGIVHQVTNMFSRPVSHSDIHAPGERLPALSDYTGKEVEHQRAVEDNESSVAATPGRAVRNIGKELKKLRSEMTSIIR
jgi:hypothetical protein